MHENFISGITLVTTYSSASILYQNNKGILWCRSFSSQKLRLNPSEKPPSHFFSCQKCASNPSIIWTKILFQNCFTNDRDKIRHKTKHFFMDYAHFISFAWTSNNEHRTLNFKFFENPILGIKSGTKPNTFSRIIVLFISLART